MGALPGLMGYLHFHQNGVPLFFQGEIVKPSLNYYMLPISIACATDETNEAADVPDGFLQEKNDTRRSDKMIIALGNVHV